MIVWIQVLNCQNCNHCLKCHSSPRLSFPSWLLVSSQGAGKIFLHQMVGDWREKPKSFVGTLSALDRGHPKCIDLFRTLNHSVIKHRLSCDCLFNCQNGNNNCLNCQNCPQLSKIVKIIKKSSKLSKIVKYCQKLSKIVKIVKIVKNCQNFSKEFKIVKNCQNVSKVMFPHHCDQMSQRSQVSGVAL